MTTFFHKELAPIKGRNFFVGDIHGMFQLLNQALDKVNFDPSIDRLNLTGDAINRGPLSPHVKWWLTQPWCEGVLGNNEFKLIKAHEDGTVDEGFVTRGKAWFYEMNHAQRQEYVDLFKKLPLAMTVPVGFEKIGVVHGEVIGAWKSMLDGIATSDQEVIKRTMEGRTRVQWKRNSPVTGILAVVVGHTPWHVPHWRGNTLYIDTGAYRTGLLTVVEGRQVAKDARFLAEANQLMKAS